MDKSESLQLERAMMSDSGAREIASPNHVVYIVDDESSIREGLRIRVEAESLHAETFASAESFLEDLNDSACGCVVIDIYMNSLSGIELLERLQSRNCQLPVILISGRGDIPTVVQGMKLGAIDFLQKPVSMEVMMKTIRKALSSGDRLRRERIAKLSVREKFQTLSARELDVLRYVVQGAASKQIARELGISIKTVSHHRENIIAKCGAANTADVVRMAQDAEICGPLQNPA